MCQNQAKILRCWRTPCQRRAIFPVGAATHGKPALEHVYPGGLKSVEESMLEQLVKDYSLWEGPTLEEEKTVSRKEQQR